MNNRAVRTENIKPQTKPLNNYGVIEIENTCSYDPSRAEKLLSDLNLAGINDEDRPIIEKLCMKYNDVFCLKDDKLTVTKTYQPSLVVKLDTHPVYTRPYKLPTSSEGRSHITFGSFSRILPMHSGPKREISKTKMFVAKPYILELYCFRDK